MRIEPIELGKQLIKSLLSFIISTTKACATGPANRIQLINEDYTRSIFFCVGEKITNPACTDANKHFYKL